MICGARLHEHYSRPALAHAFAPVDARARAVMAVASHLASSMDILDKGARLGHAPIEKAIVMALQPTLNRLTNERVLGHAARKHEGEDHRSVEGGGANRLNVLHHVVNTREDLWHTWREEAMEIA